MDDKETSSCCGGCGNSAPPNDPPSNNATSKKENTTTTIPVAVVKERGGVVIFDRTGLAISYHHDSPDLCFDNCHGEHLYCLDETGHHGVPADSNCASCDIQDQPHLHAHFKHQCDLATDGSTAINNVVLFPDDETYQLESSNPIPECCPTTTKTKTAVQRTTHQQHSNHYTLISTVQHGDHHDALVVSADAEALELQHDCVHCGAWITHGRFEKLYTRPLLSLKNHQSLSFYHQVQKQQEFLQSTLYVSSICCASEIPHIESVLQSQFETDLSSIRVNTTSKLVYIQHAATVTTQDLSDCLSKQGFGNNIRQEALSMAANVSVSVSSVLKIHDDVKLDEGILQKLVASHQLESYEWNDKTTLVVTHAPITLTAPQLVALLQSQHKVHATIVADGLQEALQQQSSELLSSNQVNKSARWPRPTVVVSGLFWIISMLSLLGGNWEHLKWVALASVAFGLPPIANKAIRTLCRTQLDTNCLMLFASLGAIALQDFTEAAAVVFLFALSEWLEVRATTRARQALSAICELQPDTAELVQPRTQQVITVPASMVAVQSLVSVKTGNVIPCDGIVVEGMSTVDESSLTGEARPIRKGPSDKVSGGTVNSGLSPLLIRTTATADNSAVSKLIRLVEMAQANRSNTEKLVDRFASYYTPIIVLAAVLMCSVPWAFGTDTGNEWTHNGLILIVVACPCALIISTPVCYVAGLTAAAQKGVLIKGGAYLEALNSIHTICFDKTGTLTNGEFALLHMETASSLDRQTVWEYLVVMEERASHPVAQAILMAARNENVQQSSFKLEQHKIVNGEGVTGIVNGKQVNVGNERMFERLGLLSTLSTGFQHQVQDWKALGGTVGYLSIDGHGIVCAYCATDAVRNESRVVVKSLKKRGINITMLTGDNHDAAVTVGKQVGLEESDIQSKLLPEEKLNYVKALTEETMPRGLCNPCSSKHLVLMCGDGVNDAPALAAADVGVAMGEGAALSMETSDITLLDSNLEKLEYSVQIGKRVTGKIIQNVIFSLVTKFIVLGFALAGKTELWAAIATDVGSMLLVTLNAMTLLPRKRAGLVPGCNSDNVPLGASKQPCSKGCCDITTEKQIDQEPCTKGCCDDRKNVDESKSCSKGCCEEKVVDSCTKECCDRDESVKSQSCTKECCETKTAIDDKSNPA